MGNSLKKVLSLVMIALLVITSTPAMSFAAEKFSINIIEVTSNSAKVKLNHPTTGATYTAEIEGGSFNPEDLKITGLEAETKYKVKVIESIKEFVPYKVFSHDNKFYYNDKNKNKDKYKDDDKGNDVKINDTNMIYYKDKSNKIYAFSNDKENYYYDVEKIKENDSEKTFTTNKMPMVKIIIGTGGVAFVDGKEKPAGTHTLYYHVGSIITISPYANAGYTGGVPEWKYTVQGTENETINVPFTSVSKVYDLNYYQTNGYFSGYNPDGSDKAEHNPMNDVLSAELNATPKNPILQLGDSVSIKLNVNILDGDYPNGRLNEVDFYQDKKDKQTFGNSPDSNPVTYNHTIPSSESELLAAGFALGTPTPTHKVYTKTLSYDLVDRYHTDVAAAILTSTTATITVNVPLPTYTVTFDAAGGSPTPAPVVVISGNTVAQPADPILVGKKFINWTLDGKDYIFTNEVKSNLYLVANYSVVPPVEPEVKYTVTFDAAGGSPTPAPVVVISGSSVAQPADPLLDGYKFNNWTLDGQEYIFTNEVKSNLNLVAKYTKVVAPPENPSEVPETPSEVVTPPTTEDEDNYVYLTIIPATEASTETLLPEAVALGEAKIVDFDSFQSNLAQETTEEVVEEITNEATPLADALPKTGQLPVEVFYGIGGLISAAGVFLKRKK